MEKYVKFFTLSIQTSMEYRLNFILALFNVAVPMIIQYFIWTSIFNNTHDSTVYGYSYTQIIVYTLMAGIVSALVAAGFEHDISRDIKDGGLSKFFIQPIRYFPCKLCSFLGGKFIQSGIMLAIAIVILFLLNRILGYNSGFQRFCMFLLSILFAQILNYSIYFCLATIAFWVENVFYLFVGFRLLVVIASGGMFPLDILGTKILNICKFIPFEYITYYPVNVINGKLSFNEVSSGIIIQCVWICLFFVLANTLWKIGVKKYIAVGG